MSQSIIVTEFTRTDRKVQAIRRGVDDTWVLRCTNGPTWFWNTQTEGWDISSKPDFTLDAKYHMTEAAAMWLIIRINPQQ